MSSRHICILYNLQSHQQCCAYKISPQNLKPNSTNLINLIKLCYKNLLPTFSIVAAIHLFISSHDEIKDLCSMDKKTGRRYLRRVRIVTKKSNQHILSNCFIEIGFVGSNNFYFLKLHKHFLNTFSNLNIKKSPGDCRSLCFGADEGI